jgi:hypothetical protein
MYMRIREITQLTEAVTPAQQAAQRAGLGSLAALNREQVKASVLAQLPRYAKKSIPIFGWAYMLYDLYVRVVEEKDYKGAMMSLGVDSLAAVAAVFTGGVGGFLVQIAGVAALVARDTYGQHFCLDPKTGQPMKCITGNKNNIPLQWEDDNLPGYKERHAEYLEMVTSILNQMAEDIVSMLPKDTAKISGAQGAANARNALKNSNTAGNPSPALHPERYPK